MSKEEFFEKIKEFDGKLGMWQVVVDQLSMADFIVGCYYDENEKMWNVYKNSERGIHSVRLSTTSEKETFKKLYSMIMFIYENINPNKN
jgi:hypothetical protein